MRINTRVPEMMGAPLSRNTALVLVLLATACVLPACVALGGAAPAPSLAPARLGFFELQASKYQSRVAERSSQDRCLVAWGKTQAPPPPPTALEKVKGALAGTVGFFQAAVAGGFAATVMFPVDMAKTRMQACAQTEASVAAAQRTYTGTFQTIGKVFTTEGPLSLFRGLAPVLIGSAPEMAVQITAYEMTREALVKNGQDPKDFKVQLAAGTVSGFSHVIASNPMEVLKVRGQVLGAAGGGLVAAVKDVGVMGLFQGVGACWARDVPFSMIYFPTYAFVKDKLEAQGQPAIACSLGAGLVAGVTAAAPTTPCDVVKTRMQNPNAAASGLRATVKSMYQTEGLQSFFVGVRPRVGRVAPYLALSLTGYESLKALGKYMEDKKPIQKALGLYVEPPAKKR